MSSPTNVRFPDQVDLRLVDFARRTGVKKSVVIVSAVREWLRMQENPGIVFVPTNTGERRAALVSGPQVWTIAESWQQHDPTERTPAQVADAVGLAVSQVEAALQYWADYPDEINELLDRQHAEQDAALAAWERRRSLDVAS